MEKAYDPKDLVQKLKSKGLDIAEESVKELVKAVSEWSQESAKLGQKPMIDGIVLIGAPLLEKFAVEQADKIDGEQG